MRVIEYLDTYKHCTIKLCRLITGKWMFAITVHTGRVHKNINMGYIFMRPFSLN